MSSQSGVTILGTPAAVVANLAHPSIDLQLTMAGNHTGNLTFQLAVTRMLAGQKKYVPKATMPHIEPDALIGSSTSYQPLRRCAS